MNADQRSPALERLKLPEPLAEVLPSGTHSTEPNQERVQSWVRITARLDAPPRRKTAVLRPIPLLALGALGLAIALFLGVEPRGREPAASVASRPNASLDAVPEAPRLPPDLRLSDGTEFQRLSGDARAAANEHPRATFADGSTLTALTPDTVVEPLAMTARDVTLRLVSGAVDVHVVKGGARQWTLEAGELRVEVVGTRFVVTRSPEVSSVHVTEGAVLVRSPKLPDGAKRLLVGDRVEFAQQEPPLEPNHVTFDALQAKSDAARRAGDLHGSAVHLERLLRVFPDDPRSGVAAFQLAVVKQQLGAPPANVVTAFEVALAKARGQSLRQDCYWRLVLALEHAGRTQQAQRCAEESLRDYPNGRYAAELRRRLPAALAAPTPLP